MVINMLVLCSLFSGMLHPHLADVLESLNDEDRLQVIIHMNERLDLSGLSDNIKKPARIQMLKDFANSSQADLLNHLSQYPEEVSLVKQYWIFNGVIIKTTNKFVRSLVQRHDIDYIIDDYQIKFDDFITSKNQSFAERTPEWNISRIKADSCWDDGYDGTGIIVGMMDTGVDTSHPALQGRYVPGGFFDPVNGLTDPYDDHGHGTFAMGIVCGGDGNGPFVNDIGVAPGAHYICAKIFNSSGGAQLSWIHDAFQWMSLQDVQTVNNSWGGTGGSTEFWDDCLNWRNLGIVPVFSAGSNGPGAGTIASPGDYPTITGVGATDVNDNIASFSSRGPAPDQYPWNDSSFWARPDWDLTKPDISAPGVDIRSAWPGMGYTIMSGTSWSCAHVTGAYAILMQGDSTADYEELYQTLLDYADEPPQGAPYPNNDYGWGRVNLYAALNVIGVKETEELAGMQSLLSVSPNPFRLSATIKFQIPNSKSQNPATFGGMLKIYNAAGQVVKSFNLCDLPQSVLSVSWNGTDHAGQSLPGGVYFVHFETGESREIEKTILLR